MSNNNIPHSSLLGPHFENAVARGLGMWPKGSLFLAAVSGGADSTAMLSALSSLQKTARFSFCCLHVEHGIRSVEESRGDAEAVRSLCEKFDIPCTIASIPRGKIAKMAKEKGVGIEAAARFFRHRMWNREMERVHANRVLVAHTQDDFLETLLMRILRGSGAAGLAGMKADTGSVLRPLLSLTRLDVLAYLEERGISYRTDSTNSDTRYFRNKVRHCLIPALDAFSSWRKNLLALAETQNLTADFLEKTAQHIQWTTDEKSSILNTDKKTFFSYHEIIREQAVFDAVDRVHGQAGPYPDPPVRRLVKSLPKRSVIRRFCKGETPVVDAGPVRIETKGSRIFVRTARQASESGSVLLIKNAGTYTLGDILLEITREDGGEYSCRMIRYRGK
jgi:tRNA(Ile)-lysidine synthase